MHRRLNKNPWASAAQARFGEGVEKGPEKWYEHPECPLNRETFKGGRGWLAKVLKEGQVQPGDLVKRTR